MEKKKKKEGRREKRGREGEMAFFVVVPDSQFLCFIIQQNLGGIVWYFSQKGKVFYCQTQYIDLAVIFKPPVNKF